MKNTKILIVEDESIIAKDLQSILTEAGYEVPYTADNSKEALHYVEILAPDLILMDVVIKGPVDGITTAQIISSLYDIPIIFLSAFSDRATLDRARIVGSFGYLLKPCDERELLIAVDFGLQKANMDRALKQRNDLITSVISQFEKGIIITNNEGLIEVINEKALQFLGSTENETIHRAIDEVLPGFQKDVYEKELPAEAPKVEPTVAPHRLLYSNQKLLNRDNEFSGNLIYLYMK